MSDNSIVVIDETLPAVPLSRAKILSQEQFDGLWRVANIASSASLGKTKHSAPSAMMLLTLGYELGLSPMQSILGIHVINGTPSISGALMKALVSRSGKGTFEITGDEITGVTVKGTRTDTGETYSETWTMERARIAGLGKDTWQKYPKTMLTWRCIGGVCRVLFSDVTLGLYTVDEADFEGKVEVDENGDYVGEIKKTLNQLPNGNTASVKPAPMETPPHIAKKDIVWGSPESIKMLMDLGVKELLWDENYRPEHVLIELGKSAWTDFAKGADAVKAIKAIFKPRNLEEDSDPRDIDPMEVTEAEYTE